ncbi:MAG: SGNH/GDSL hydrolase family protein [Armatimonadetes bacterium]|nr:SGNH/GDSL hydrolase family protein [Armatimonadota bacterium]
MPSENSPFVGRRESWDYAAAMRGVARGFTGTEGVVLHLGDSITFAAPYTAWARHGKGKTPEDEAILKWSHCGKRNELDGWYLASHEVSDLSSYTAASGIRADQYLAGGFKGLLPLDDIVKKYNPQIAIVMLGTNDAWQGRPANEFASDMNRLLRRLLENGTVPVLSTIPPMIPAPELGDQYNAELWKLAEHHKLPLIDFHGEIVGRRPDGSWNGAILNKDDPHPTASRVGVTPESEPTEENLRESGYLLRGWLSVRKLAEVKSRVWDSQTGRGS